MGITDIGEFKSYSMTRFKGILDFDGSQQPQDPKSDPGVGGREGERIVELLSEVQLPPSRPFTLCVRRTGVRQV